MFCADILNVVSQKLSSVTGQLDLAPADDSAARQALQAQKHQLKAEVRSLRATHQLLEDTVQFLG